MLINISNLSITKQISNSDIILTCFGCFLGYLQPHLIRAKNVKGADARVYIRGAYIGDAFVRDVYVNSDDLVPSAIGW